MFGGSAARQPICEQWETDRQQTHIKNRLIGPAGGSGTPTDSREDRKIRERWRMMRRRGVILFFCASLDKQGKGGVKEKMTEVKLFAAW